MSDSHTTTVARLEAIARRWIEEGWQRGNLAVIDELHASDFVDRDSAGRPSDREGFKAGVARLYEAFPDFHAVVEDLVTDAARGKIAVRWSATGTQRGAYLGAAPTNKPVTFKGIEIIRIVDGRIAERWGEWDGIDLLGQLGRFE